MSARRAPARSREPRRRPRRRLVALTGTPGTGKSSVARALGPRWSSIEVAALAARTGTSRGRGRRTIVDLPALRARLRRSPPGVDLLVGHLAHLLPVGGVIVLRCHPRELRRRLARARRGGPAERAANVVAEAVDAILLEAVATGRPVHEIDTTGRSVGAVAREASRWLAGPRRARFGRIDWLSDRSVTAHLLDEAG